MLTVYLCLIKREDVSRYQDLFNIIVIKGLQLKIHDIQQEEHVIMQESRYM